MKKNFNLKLIWSVLICTSSLSILAQEIEKDDWKMVSNTDGISVYSRTKQNSPIEEIKINCTVKASMQSVASFLADVDAYSEWVYKCNSSSLLTKKKNNEFSYYITLDFPFPFVDRDLTIESRHWIDQNTGRYHSKSIAAKSEIIHDEEYVHIKEFESEWEITPIGNGELQVEYNSISNPGGDIPVFLVNMVIAKGPRETMKEFIRLVESAENLKF